MRLSECSTESRAPVDLPSLPGLERETLSSIREVAVFGTFRAATSFGQMAAVGSSTQTMTEDMQADKIDFDSFADSYDEALQQGLAITGEDRAYYAEGRIACLARELAARGVVSRRVLDFGCGTGSSTPLLLRYLEAEFLVGVDVSPASLETARQIHAAPNVSFAAVDTDSRPGADFDVAYCNGVYHHIPPEARDEACNYVYAALKPGGWFGLFENNPLNPGTRYVMSRCPFDSDARILYPGEVRRLLEHTGFSVRATRYLFYFPSCLRFLRWTEQYLEQLPLGGQYLVLAQK